jgi:hypothetical protein
MRGRAVARPVRDVADLIGAATPAWATLAAAGRVRLSLNAIAPI